MKKSGDFDAAVRVVRRVVGCTGCPSESEDSESTKSTRALGGSRNRGPSLAMVVWCVNRATIRFPTIWAGVGVGNGSDDAALWIGVEGGDRTVT